MTGSRKTPLAALALLLGASYSGCLLAESNAGSGPGSLSANASVVIQIVIPEQLMVDLPATSDPDEAVTTRYRLNTGWLSVTGGQTQAGTEALNYVEWGERHQIELDPAGTYVISSP